MGCSTSLQAQRTGEYAAPDFHRKYNVGKKLGEGTFGQVRVVLDRQTKETRAVKVMCLVNERNLADQSLIRAAKQETRMWRAIGEHDNCVSLLETYIDHSMVYLVMERCENSLMDELQEMPRTSEQRIAAFFVDMLLGIGHLHSLGIVHRDIKPNNFLFGLSGIVKLCDFGMAARLPRRGGLLRGTYGTAPYMSPEIIRDNVGHGVPTDIWSFGATAYVLLYGDFPYVPQEASAKAMKSVIERGSVRPKYQRYGSTGEVLEPPSELVEAFVRSLLRRNSAERPTVQEALNLDFLRLARQTTQSTSPDQSPEQKDEVATPVTTPGLTPGGMWKERMEEAVQTVSGKALAFGKALSGRTKRRPEEDCLASALNEASKKTQQYEPPVNPIVQRGLEEVLVRLQHQVLHFSEPPQADVFIGLPDEAGPTIMRARSKRSTHSGIMRTPHAMTPKEGAASPITGAVAVDGNGFPSVQLAAFLSAIKLGGTHPPSTSLSPGHSPTTSTVWVSQDFGSPTLAKRRSNTGDSPVLLGGCHRPKLVVS
mmetsp:Transcript_23286/g.51131  ORF Transcript_23286/g.51131 Transcript_23286/m.51131 type:complete len:538 (-) Transcript_23286:388-2001(-)